MYESGVVLPRYYLGRIASYRRSFGYVFHYHSSCANGGVTVNIYIFHYAYMWTNINVIANYAWCILVSANAKKLADVYIVSNNGSAIYYNSDAMPDIEAVANFSVTGNLNAIFHSHMLMHKYC